MLKFICSVSVLFLFTTQATADTVKVGEGTRPYISVVNQRVGYPNSKQGEEVYEAETGWIIVSYEVVEHHKYGQSGWSVSKVAAGSDFISEERVKEVFKELTDYAREEKKDGVYRERLEKLKDYLLDVHKHTKASHSRITIKWRVQHDGKPWDMKGGSMHLGLRLNLARALRPEDATKMITDFKVAIRRGSDLGHPALRYNAPKKNVMKAADLGGSGVIRTVHSRTIIATHDDEKWLMKQQTLECTPPDGGWSRLTFIPLGGSDFKIKTVHGRFLIATHADEGWLIKQQEARYTPADGGWSRFTVIPKGGGKFLLRTVHGRYIRATHENEGWVLNQAIERETPQDGGWSLLELSSPD